MKKIILFSFLVLTTAALLNINIGQAQTKSLKAETLENLQAIVEKLLQQVQELQARLKQVKATQSENATKPIITIQPAEQFITLEELPDSPKVSCVLPVLQIGSRHKSVYLLQMLLKQHGSYPEGFITGYFGRLTTAAVQRFQQSQGLAVTGKLDSETLVQLQTVVSQYYPQCSGTIPREGVKVYSPAEGAKWRMGGTYLIQWTPARAINPEPVESGTSQSSVSSATI